MGLSLQKKDLNKAWYVVLAILPLILYAKSMAFDFLPSWDDEEYVLNNTRIRAFTFDNLKAIFTTTFFYNYTPLHLLSYSIDHAIWGLNPAGYHLTNIILHAINSVLVYTVLKRLTSKDCIALLASLIFAVHPINVENVAWVAERKTLLSGMFALLSIRSYLEFSREGVKRPLIYSIVFYILSMLSKPMAITMPLVFAAYELVIAKNLKHRLIPLIPFFIIAAFGAFMAMYSQMGHNAIEKDSLSLEMLLGTVYPTMLPVFWKYASLIVWPFNLNGYYDTTVYYSFLAPASLLSLIGIIIVTVLVFWKGGPQTRFWFLWFWIWLLPVSNIVPLPVFYADRYMYMPAVSFYVLAGGVLAFLFFKADKLKTLSYAAGALLVFVCFVAAFKRSDVWKNDLVFWTDTVKNSPNQYKARLNLGYALEMRSMYTEAEKEYEAALAIYPSQEALSNLTMVRLKKAYNANKQP